MNNEGLSVDLGPIFEPKMTVGYDKDKGVTCTISFKVDIAPGDIARILDAGKTTTLRARIFTVAPPMLPDRQGDQLGLGAAPPASPTVYGLELVEDVEHGIEVGKETATATLEAQLSRPLRGSVD